MVRRAGNSRERLMHHIDTLNADVKVGSGMDQLLDIKLVLATKSARDEVRPLVAMPFERTRVARHYRFSSPCLDGDADGTLTRHIPLSVPR